MAIKRQLAFNPISFLAKVGEAGALAGTARPMIAPSKCVGSHARPAGLFNFAQTFRATLSNVQKSRRLTMGRDPVTGSDQVTRSKTLEL